MIFVHGWVWRILGPTWNSRKSMPTLRFPQGPWTTFWCARGCYAYNLSSFQIQTPTWLCLSHFAFNFLFVYTTTPSISWCIALVYHNEQTSRKILDGRDGDVIWVPGTYLLFFFSGITCFYFLFRWRRWRTTTADNGQLQWHITPPTMAAATPGPSNVECGRDNDVQR